MRKRCMGYIMRQEGVRGGLEAGGLEAGGRTALCHDSLVCSESETARTYGKAGRGEALRVPPYTVHYYDLPVAHEQKAFKHPE